MTKTELAKYAQVLEAKEADLRGTITNGRKVIIPDQKSSDPADETQFVGMQEFEMKNLDANTITLHKVQTARQRLNDGTYGICGECEEEISQKRLKAIPWAPRCVRCQEAVDKSGRQPTLSVAPA